MVTDSKIRLLIADDHDVYRNGLKMLVSEETEIEIVGEASNGERLVELALKLIPDVILTDLKMPGLHGIEAIKQLVKAGSKTRYIALPHLIPSS